MNKYWKYLIFPRFLDAVRDCTYVNMDDVDLQSTLNNILLDAIQEFKFCKVSLAYELDESYDALDSGTYGYYFTSDEIGEPEYKVLISLMKYYWVSAQITWDSNFKNPFFDKDIKGYSPGNLLTAMRGMLEEYRGQADRDMFNYNRINKEGKVAWGQINHA